MVPFNDKYGSEIQYIKWVIKLKYKRQGTILTDIGVKNRLKPVGKEFPTLYPM